MSQNEITDFSPVDNNNTDLSGTTVTQGQMYPYMVDNAFRNIMGMIGRWTSSDTIASSGTTDIGAQAEAYLTVSGTTTITSFGTIRAGTIRFLRFSGILTLTHNGTSLILPNSASITTAAGDTAIFVSEGSGNWRCLFYFRSNGQALSGSGVPSYAYGLSLTTNGSDATNDIDIATGIAFDPTGSLSLAIVSALTKRLDANWAVGTNQGGLDTGAVGNNTYYIWLIGRPDTGVVDVLFSLSNSSPTMPTNYTQKILLGFVVRAAGVNRLPYLTLPIAWLNKWVGEGQIKFPATQNSSSDATTLDDYQETTVTAALTTTGGSLSAATSTARVTKIGRLVTQNGEVAITNAGTATGNLNVALSYQGAVGASGGAFESQATGFTCSAAIVAPYNQITIAKYDGTTIIASGRTISYSVTYVV